MIDASSDNACLSIPIRKFVLSGRNFWSAVAFGILGGATSLFLMMTILHCVDTAIGLYSFSREFNFHLHTNPSMLFGWLGDVIPRFESARGASFFDLPAWAGMGVLILILFLAHYRRFSRPVGVSLIENSLAAPAVRSLLSRFGYFKDLKMTVASEGRASNDFLSVGRYFYAPRGQVSRLLKGKPAENQSKALTFFMAHEYAHAVTKDNLANSAFLVLTSLYVFVFLSLIGPILFLASALAASSPMGAVATVPLSLGVFLLFSSSVALCFHGVLISYIKAREFLPTKRPSPLCLRSIILTACGKMCSGRMRLAR